MARILIAGCGYVGQELGLRLVREGHFVCGLRRSPGQLPPGLRGFSADLTRPETLRDLPGPFDVVFYTAGADRRSEAGYRSAYLEGLGNLIGALQGQNPPVRRLFFTSSTAVYGQSGGEWVDEDSPAEAGHFRGRLLRDAEQVLLGGPIAGTVVRVGGIYGPGRQRLIDSVRRGEACCFEGPPRYLNHVHRDDCAGALAHLMGVDSPRSLYMLVDHEPAEQCGVLRWIAGRLKVPVPRRAPAGAGKPNRGTKRCRNARLVESGYAFRYPTFREGYAALIAGVGV
ncbi:MAG: NAD-dependent epimerase/dehydratase family protein [Acidobacteriota bacterium]|nr:NAD-dependent epimerase/dehydratase family protein [Acidobacteriota bacterium]MDE2963827.1 NAD-dependent epimerase/dehydratase family protein [Acidobacteriota bacterium]